MPIYNPGSGSSAAKVFSTLGSGGRPVNSSAFTLSASRDSFVTYSISVASTLTITGGTTSTAFLETSPDGSIWTTVSETSQGFTGVVVVGVALNNSQIGVITGMVPANYQCRIRSSGTTSFVAGEEVLL